MMVTLLLIIFAVGYLAIAAEHSININKAASALLTAVLCWTVYIVMAGDIHLVGEQLAHHLGELSGILFFLLGAMTIVELIDAHDGFEVITSRIQTTSKRKLLWIICLLAFFLSAVLDNLTTTIVMVSLVRKLFADRNDKLLFAGMIVIAANAGGAWSPIGDVTTTMLWIGGQITALNIIGKLIIPSLVCLFIPLLIVSVRIKGNAEKPARDTAAIPVTTTPFQRNLVFCLGVGILLFVPVFKTLTHLPPFMGMLFGLGLLWVVLEMIHHERDDANKGALSVQGALQKIDTPSILFFLGILLAIAALQSTGILATLANLLDNHLGNQDLIILSIGALSAIVDNVPLVAATMGMYDIQTYPPDSYLWEFIAYCAGTGGSMLIIGSAAGVAAMGLEKIDFFWYLKKIGWLAAIGYLAGAGVYILQEILLHP